MPSPSPFDRTIDACRRAIAERNAELHALVLVLPEPSIDPSAPADAPLSGVPYVLKDTWDTAGIRTTGGSWRHRERVPSSSSGVHRALAAAGAVLLGKSNLCDLAFSPESDNHLVGATSNPFDPARTSGGSTGGGAAAIAAGMACFDWGSDFGGSIRMPAAFCGVAGLRLSHTRWPIPDFFPTTPALDLDLHGMGPLARTVDGCRVVMRAVARTLPPNDAIAPTFVGGARRVRVYGPDERAPGEWPTFVGDACTTLMAAGISFAVDRDIPSPRVVDDAYDGYLASSFRAFLATGELPLSEGLVAVAIGLASRGRLDRRLHPNTALLLALLAAGHLTIYRDGARVRERVDRVRAAVQAAWDRGELVVAPTTTYPAPLHGRALFTRGILAFAKLGNLTDSTCVAVPFGRFRNGLPRSIQVLGPPGSEDAVLDLGERLEALALA